MNIFAWWAKIVAVGSYRRIILLPRKDYGQAFGKETCIIRPSLQIHYNADFFYLEWTHEGISSLHVSAVFITGLCNHSFVFSPFSQSIYKRKNQIFQHLFNRIHSANINIFLTTCLLEIERSVLLPKLVMQIRESSLIFSGKYAD